MKMNLLYVSVPALLVVAPAFAAGPKSKPDQGKFEVRFLTGMIDHHAMAVHMSEMCLERAVHPEIKALCSTMMSTQSQEIEQMQMWLENWYDMTHEPEMHMTGEMKRLMMLTGERFETEFLQMMIKHHHKAVIEARHCQRKASHQTLLEFCDRIEMTQTHEMDLMRSWLCSWYGICNWGPKV